MVFCNRSAFGVRIGDVSPYVCTIFFQFGLGCLEAIVWDAAHSVAHMFALCFAYL